MPYSNFCMAVGLLVSTADACTVLIAGKKATVDGATLLLHTDDCANCDFRLGRMSGSGGWDADSLVCVTLAIWPWVLVVLLALTAARWAYSIATDAATTRRSRLFFRKRAEVENTPLRERTGGTRASGAGSQVWT